VIWAQNLEGMKCSETGGFRRRGIFGNKVSHGEISAILSPEHFISASHKKKLEIHLWKKRTTFINA
jgi:hypothetical protein